MFLFSSKSGGLPCELILLSKVSLKGMKTLLGFFLCMRVCKRMCVILSHGENSSNIGQSASSLHKMNSFSFALTGNPISLLI